MIWGTPISGNHQLCLNWKTRCLNSTHNDVRYVEFEQLKSLVTPNPRPFRVQHIVAPPLFWLGRQPAGVLSERYLRSYKVVPPQFCLLVSKQQVCQYIYHSNHSEIGVIELTNLAFKLLGHHLVPSRNSRVVEAHGPWRPWGRYLWFTHSSNGDFPSQTVALPEVRKTNLK